MHKEWRHLDTQGQRLQWAREHAGFDHPSDAAAALGMTGSAASTYFGHENGSRGLSKAGARYAEFFRVNYEWLMRGKGAPTPSEARIKFRPGNKYSATIDGVSIIGKAGAGPEGSIQLSADQQPLGIAPRPPGATEDTVALEVWGNSMRPLALDGWLVYYDQRQAGLTPEMFGQPCVIGLKSGHTVIKTPHPGTKRGYFHLESSNPAVTLMLDQRVKWAALVTAIIPRKAARSLMRDVKGDAIV